MDKFEKVRKSFYYRYYYQVARFRMYIAKKLYDLAEKIST